jgi:hypothetical protein
MRIGLFILLAALVMSFGCKRRPDRLVTADGMSLAGQLVSVDGSRVVFNNSETVLEREEGRIFLRDEGASHRGYVVFEDGLFLLEASNGSGSREFQAEDVSSVIWSDAAQESSIQLQIPARDGWIATGLGIDESDRIVLRASGRVSLPTGTSDPTGIDYYSTAMALVPQATNGQLVFRIGESTPVAAGTTWTGETPGEGELFLAVNRPNRESIEGVGGSYSVTVTVTPGPLGNSVLYPSPDW